MKLSFQINQPADIIFGYLTDMQKFVSVHPVITKMDRLAANRYLVHETLKMGFIPFSFTYPVTVESNHSDQTVVFRATVMKLTKIEMNFRIKSHTGFSVVEESIRFTSLLPVKNLMQRIFKKQHEQLFKNIGMRSL